MNHPRRLLKTFQLMLWRMSLALVLVAIFTSVISYTREGAGDNQTKVQAATSSNLNYQARLLNSSGNLVADGYYNLEFKLYDADSGGSALWTETYYDSNGVTAGNDNRVRVVNGYMSVNLGSQTAFPALNWDQDMWLTINVGGTTQTATPTWDGEMSPRIKLTSVPYAFQANSSRSLNQDQGTYVGTLDFDTLTDNRSFLLPDSSLATTGSPATVCVFNGSTTNCPTSGGSGNYIQNTGGSASPQTAANFNIQATNSSTNGTIGGIIRGAAGGQTVDLFQLQSSAGAILAAFQSDGKLVFGPSGSQDTNLYRSGADTLRTDDGLSVGAALAVTGNSTLTGTLTVNNTTDINVNSTTALQVRNGGTSVLTVNTTASQVGIGGPAATSTLTVGTNTTTAAGGLTFGTDTNLYRSAADTLRTDDNFVVPGLSSVSVATLTNSSYIIPGSGAAAAYLAYSPVPKYLWHDLLSFNRWWGTPTFETYNGSWSAGTLDSNLFAQKESYSATVVNGTSVTGARWMWNNANLAYSYPNWWALGFSYNGATASSKDILIESSPDGTTWTTRHTSTGNTANASPVWAYMTDNGGHTYIRLTISVTNSQPLTMASIKALSSRWGNQGGGSEYEFAYDWDSSRRITIGTTSGARSNGVLNLGSTAPTTAAEGIYFGTDVSLYRSAANILATDDSLSLLGTSSNLTVQGTGTSTIAGNLTVSGTVTTGTSLNVGGTSNQRITLISGAASHGIELGRTDGTSSTPYIDFHAGATAVDFDARLIATTGTGSNGAGTLQLQAGTLDLTGDLAVGGGDINSGASTFNFVNATVATLNIGGGVGAGGINLAGGSASTGCTIDGTNGNLTCSGAVTGGGSTGTQGWWSRSGTILQPANSGDSVTTTGDIYTTGSGTITSAGLLTGSADLQVTNAGGKTTLQLTSTGSTTGLTIGGDTNLFRASANNLATDDNLAVGGTFSSTGAASIGNGTTSVNLTIQGSSYNGVVTNVYSDTASAYSFFQRSRGTQGSPTYVTNNSFLGSFGFRGHNGTAFLSQDSARISSFATQDFTGGTHGGAIAFYTAANGTADASGSSERFRIDHNGNIRIGASATISSKLTFDAATTAAGGILFGSDTNLYRSGANTLATDDSVTLLGTGSNLTVQGTGTSSIAGNLTASGTAAVQGSGGLTIGVAGSVTGNLNLANSTSSRLVVVQGLNPSGTGNATVQIPSIAGGSTDTVCLVTLANCSGGGGGGVTSLDGLTGALTLANSSGSGATITIDNAVADGATKGIAAFNSTNFSASSGVINTIQNISTSGTPTFSSVNATSSFLFNGTNINTAGTLSNVAYLNQANNFSAANTFSSAGTALSVTNNASIGGTLAVQGSGGLTIGVAGSVTGNLSLANSSSSRMVIVQGLNPSGSGNATVQIPTIAGGATDTVCLFTLGNCSGGGVTSLNGQTGAVTINNASGSGGSVTIQDASTSQKGIATFNATNFSASSGTINTIQNIDTSASPTFANVNATTALQLNGTSINTAGTLTNVAYLSQNQTFAGVNTFRNTSDSTAAFRIQNSTASVDLLTADTTNGVIKIGTTGTATQSGSALFVTTAEFSGQLRVGDGTNRVQFDGTTKKLEYVGTARQDRQITLTPEYPGAVLTADGSNNIGTMTSDFCSNTGTLSINNSICGSGEAFNYYSWTGSGGTMDYDIYVRWQAPSDFSAFSNATDAVKMYGWRTSSTEKVELSMYQANGTQCGSTTEINSSDGTWQQTSMTGDETACSVAVNDMITFRIKLTASSTGFARASNLQINYLSKF